MLPIADLAPSFFNAEHGSPAWWGKAVLTLLLSVVMFVILFNAPARARRPIVISATFLGGVIYVLQWLWPRAIARDPGTLPLNTTESVAFWLEDAIPVLGTISNTVSAFLLGLGVYSLLRIHTTRLVKRQADWMFSLVLLTCMLLMTGFGYADWISKQGPNGAALAVSQDTWTFVNYAKDLLFDGLLQNMDGAMFSIIAFYILSAAYRAFRIRSIEATILLAAALVVMLALMGAVDYEWSKGIASMTGGDKGSFLNNFSLSEIRMWIQNNVQNPSLRAIDFGIGIGALAMALRLWLSLEKGGHTA